MQKHRKMRISDCSLKNLDNGDNGGIKENNHPCIHCNRCFKSLRGTLQHQRHCQGIPVVGELDHPPQPPPPLPPDPVTAQPSEEESFYWGNIKGSETIILMNSCYEKIVY